MAGPPKPDCEGCDFETALSSPVTAALVKAGLSELKAAPVAVHAVLGMLRTLEARGMKFPAHSDFLFGIEE